MNGYAVGVVKVSALRICVPKLDAITVIIENVEPGIGSLIVQCYDAAWYAGFGGMNGKSVQEFLGSVDAAYLAGCLGRSANLKRNERLRAYLLRIAEAIVFHFAPG